MSMQILLPKLGFAMNEGVLSAWLLPDGATVTLGQPLFALETEKAVEEVESPAAGTLKILAPAGSSYPVGTVLGEIS
jgi:pyruvate/2-oxoglutarate dehydrogenase complex dihydrolipoamide acyltransferase (E2) component